MLFGKKNAALSSVTDNDDAALTYQDAMLLGRCESVRDLRASSTEIAYVRFCQDFDDYCRVRIHFEKSDCGVYTIELLPNCERLNEEQLTNQKILQLARLDRRLNAVKLYRHLHQCSLQDAIVRLAELERLNGDSNVCK